MQKPFYNIIFGINESERVNRLLTLINHLLPGKKKGTELYTKRKISIICSFGYISKDFKSSNRIEIP